MFYLPESNMIRNQAYVYNKLMAEELNRAKNNSDAYKVFNKYINGFYSNIYKPVFKKRYANFKNLPISEFYNQNNSEIVTDLELLFQEFNGLNESIINLFNEHQNFKEYIYSEIDELNSLCAEFAALTNIPIGTSMITICEQFNRSNNIDIEKSTARHSGQYGIITLGVNSITNHSEAAEISIENHGSDNTINNGLFGDKHIVDLIEQKPKLRNNNCSDPTAIMDGMPDTWFEYQMINIEDKSDLINYDLIDLYSDEYGDVLSLKVSIDLKDIKQINWITLDPFYPMNAPKNILVKAIKLSTNQVDYIQVNKEPVTVVENLNKFAQTYNYYESTDMNLESTTGKGVWIVEPTEARYIDIYIEQHSSYKEKIGFDNNSRIIKAEEDFIEYKTGWRYCIGIKDIDVSSFEYKEESIFISKEYTTDKPIKSVMLDTIETIPEAFMSDFKMKNKWIRYYVQINNGPWMPISPSLRQPAGGEKLLSNIVIEKADELAEYIESNNIFPPKIYRINPYRHDNNEGTLYEGTILTENEPKKIRLRAVLKRPYDKKNYTPIVYGYTLKLLF